MDDTEESNTVKWDAVVLSCSNKNWTHSLQNELNIRQAKGYINEEAVVLVVEDPKVNVGSGGATINSLLTVVEYISARRGYSVVNSDVLQDCRILILHTGRLYSYEACTRPFVTLPLSRDSAEYDGPVCSLDLTYSLITSKIAVGTRPGVWVCSLDMTLALPEFLAIRSSLNSCDACAVTIPMPVKSMKDHGFYQLDSEGFVENIVYQASSDVMDKTASDDGCVLSVIGIVFLSQKVSEQLLSFHAKPPLDACTYMGLDSGQPPLKLSLFFDILLPMTSGVSEEDFVSGERGGSFGKPAGDQPSGSRHNMQQARHMLWQNLHNFKLKVGIIPGGKYLYMTDSALEHKKLILSCPLTVGVPFTWNSHAYSQIRNKCSVHDESVVISSILSDSVTVDQRSVVSNCELDGQISVGKESFISCLNIRDKKRRISFPDGSVVQGFHVYLKTLNMTRYVLTAHGKFDDVMMPTWKSMSTYCNQSWVFLLARTGIQREELWGADTESDDQLLYTAKLFPVFHATQNTGLLEVLWLMGAVDDDSEKSIHKRWRESWRLSLGEILTFVDTEESFSSRRDLFYKMELSELKSVLEHQGDKGFCSMYNSASVEGYTELVLDTLDKVASESKLPSVAARTLANIADVLGAKAGRRGGLRSGPAGNVSWRKAFDLLEENDVKAGVAALAKERSKWMSRPDLLIRAARHYEGAAQILIRHAVMTAKEFFTFEEGSLPLMNQWICARCPARIDLSGGWSDTPPITYEHGGAVIMAAVLVDGKRPIGARTKRIKEPVIRLRLISESDARLDVECCQLQDLEDYCQPHATGSLLKAAFICVDLVNLKSKMSLAQQLMDNYGGGFEMESWSNLPHGSGMGTSSILAGAVLASLLTAAGKKFDSKSLIHAVLYLEQLLTTGGGWQDQVGGLLGGVQLAVSEDKLPLKVDMIEMEISDRRLLQFNERLLLVYTGKTRLARNLLQDVVRNWYARNPFIVDTENKLVALAQKCSNAFIDGDFQLVGECVCQYWELKKRLAPGCESVTIARIMSVCRPYVYGMCSAGAGGGGFIYGILKEPNCHGLVKTILEQQEGLDAVVYSATIDTDGLTVEVEDVPV